MTMFEKYREAFRQAITRLNVSLDHRDKARNMTECGKLEVLKDILIDMGHKVEGSVIPDKETGMHRAIYITIDGESMGNFTGDTKGLFEIFTPEADSDDETKE